MERFPFSQECFQEEFNEFGQYILKKNMVDV